MLARQLPNSPKAEELAANVAMMTRDLYAMGLKDFDGDRVSAAMTQVAIQIGKWPTSHMIKNNLPPRRRHHLKALENHFVPPIIKEGIKEKGLERENSETSEEHRQRCLDAMRESGGYGKAVAEHLEGKMDQKAVEK